MADQEETRRGMEQHIGRRVEMSGAHPQRGKVGWVSRVEDVNGAPAMIIKLLNGVEYPITDPQCVMFITETRIEDL